MASISSNRYRPRATPTEATRGVAGVVATLDAGTSMALRRRTLIATNLLLATLPLLMAPHLLMLLCLRTIIIPTTLPRSTNSPSIATSRHTGRLSSRSSNSHSSSRSRHSSSRNRSRRHSLSLRRRNSHIYRTILRILTSKVDHPISHGGPLGRRVISLLDLSLVAGVDAAALMETVADTRLQQPWAPPFASDLIAARSSLLQ